MSRFVSLLIDRYGFKVFGELETDPLVNNRIDLYISTDFYSVDDRVYFSEEYYPEEGQLIGSTTVLNNGSSRDFIYYEFETNLVGLVHSAIKARLYVDDVYIRTIGWNIPTFDTNDYKTKIEYLYLDGHELQRDSLIINEPSNLTNGLNINKTTDQDYLIKNYTASLSYFSNYVNVFKDQLIFSNSNFIIGDITEEIFFDVEIYNSYDFPVTISDINVVNLTGIDVSLSNDVIRGYFSTNLHIVVLEDGESNNNGYIEITLTNNDKYIIQMNYTRQNILDFSKFNKLESQTFEYKTEILKSINNIEDRLGVMPRPRYYMQSTFELTDDERIYFENEILSNKNGIFYTPIKYSTMDAVVVDEFTINGDFRYKTIGVGDNVYLVDGDLNTMVTVNSINESFTQISVTRIPFQITGDVLLYPVLITQISENISSSVYNSDYTRYTIVFEDSSLKKNHLLTNTDFISKKIDGLDFYDFLMPNTGEQISRSINRNIEIIDNGISNSKKFFISGNSIYIDEFTYFIGGEDGEKDINDFKRIFEKQKGQLGEFYTIKPNFAFSIIEDIKKDSKFVITKTSKNYEMFKNGLFKYIYLLTYDGYLILEIENVLKMKEDKTEVIYFKESFANDILMKDIIGFLPVVKTRFNSDSLSLIHYGANNAKVSISLINVR